MKRVILTFAIISASLLAGCAVNGCAGSANPDPDVCAMNSQAMMNLGVALMQESRPPPPSFQCYTNRDFLGNIVTRCN